MLPPLGNAGSPAGRTTPEITARIGATAPVPVWFVTAHDTAAAFSAVTPAARPEDRLTAVVACGSSAFAGVVLPPPLPPETAPPRAYTQETAAGGATPLVTNLSDLFLLQQAHRAQPAQTDRHAPPAHAH